MTKTPKKAKPSHSTEPIQVPQMPLDDALRVLLKSKPQHKEVKKKKS